jgi:glycosyltransferase involved in cell wall biosynthesis
MNVLYVDATRGLYGASRMLLTLLSELDRREVRPYVALSSDVDDGDLRLVEALRSLRVPTLQYPLAVFRRSKYLNPRGALFIAGALVRSTRLLARLIRKHDIHLVQSNTSTVLSGALAARMAGVPHVWHVHEIFRPSDGRVFPALLDALADRVVAISDAAAASLVQYRPGLASKLVTIKNGIDPEPFRNVTPAQVAHLRQELRIEPGEMVVGMLGRIGMWKGEGNFIEVARSVAERMPGVKFVITGGTFDRRDHLLHALRERVRAAGLEGRVIVTGLRTDIHALLNLFDVLVHLPDRPEPFGLVVVEAMSARKPVVTWEAGALPEIVSNGATGWVVPFGDTRAASERTTALLADPVARAHMGDLGSRRVNREFTAARYASQFLSIYKELAIQS